MSTTSDVKEAFIHYIWKVKQFDKQLLKTTAGDTLRILQFGMHNHDSGPDFSNAKIKLNKTIWHGHIEMHVRASDWYRHRHEQDSNYDNVILHVVWEADHDIQLSDGTLLPTLEIKDRVDYSLVARHDKLISTGDWIPCARQIHKVNQMKLPFWLKNLAVERLSQRYDYLKHHFELVRGDWEQLFFQELARSFGLKPNADAFSALASSISILYIFKYRHDIDYIESILFGQSGLIPKQPNDDYPKMLIKHHSYLSKMLQLRPIPLEYWKMSRLRPPNFPTIRVAQLAYLYHSKNLSFRALLYLSNKEIIDYFDGISTTEYWRDHYRFDKESVEKIKTLGHSRKQIILINAIVPMLFFYGKVKQNDAYIDKSLQLLDLLKMEKNSIIQRFQDLGIQASTAFDSQALLQLKKSYCDQKRCLSCSIGHSLLSL